MKLNKLVLAPLGALLIGINGCYAEDKSLSGTETSQALPSEKQFDSMDANRDGILTQSEASVDKKLYKDWGIADADQNGVVSKSEFILYTGEATSAGQPAKEQAQPEYDSKM